MGCRKERLTHFGSQGQTWAFPETNQWVVAFILSPKPASWMLAMLYEPPLKSWSLKTSKARCSPSSHSHRVSEYCYREFFNTREKKEKRRSPFKVFVNGPETELCPKRQSCRSYTRAAKAAGKAHVAKNIFIMALLSSGLTCWKVRTELYQLWFLILFSPPSHL